MFWANAATMELLNLIQYRNAAVAIPREPLDERAMAKAVVLTVAESGYRILERIAFWRELPFTGRILNRLADALEAICDEIEKWGSDARTP